MSPVGKIGNDIELQNILLLDNLVRIAVDLRTTNYELRASVTSLNSIISVDDLEIVGVVDQRISIMTGNFVVPRHSKFLVPPP